MKLTKLKKVFETVLFILFIVSVIFMITNFGTIKKISIKLFRHPLIYISHVQRQYMISQSELCRNSSSVLNVKIPDLYEVDRFVVIWEMTSCSHKIVVCILVFYKKQMNIILGSCLRQATSHPSPSDKVVLWSLVSNSRAETASLSPCLPILMSVIIR